MGWLMATAGVTEEDLEGSTREMAQELLVRTAQMAARVVQVGPEEWQEMTLLERRILMEACVEARGLRPFPTRARAIDESMELLRAVMEVEV